MEDKQSIVSPRGSICNDQFLFSNTKEDLVRLENRILLPKQSVPVGIKVKKLNFLNSNTYANDKDSKDKKP